MFKKKEKEKKRKLFSSFIRNYIQETILFFATYRNNYAKSANDVFSD